MNPPAIRRFRCSDNSRPRERGVTMVLVAIALVAIIAMAALSIDVITLYLAKEEAQRSADAAALAAARVISLSGMTGDPNNSTSSWQAICGGAGSPATLEATAVAKQSAVGGAAATVVVTYSAGSTTGGDCSALPAPFGVNPMVTVQLARASLPTFFSRIWGNRGNSVSASATAEAFNPSYSGSVGNQVSGTIVPVQPTCAKPWVVPNRDPLNPPPNNSGDGPVYCDQGVPCKKFVQTTDGTITNPGISLNGGGSTGVIGETFWLTPDCHYSGTGCNLRGTNPQIQANYPQGQRIPAPPNLQYLPGQTVYAASAVPSCSAGTSLYQAAIAGCDESSVHQCGVQSSSLSSPNLIDLSENPGGSGDTTNGVQCLINEGDAGDRQPDGQDRLNNNNNNYGAPSSYPFEMLAGSSNPLVTSAGLRSGSPITSSNSIVSMPIYDDTVHINSSGTTAVTIVGFLQVFINAVDPYGNVYVTVLNVAGCSDGTGAYTVSPNPVTGSSPVPVRLITPP